MILSKMTAELSIALRVDEKIPILGLFFVYFIVAGVNYVTRFS